MHDGAAPGLPLGWPATLPSCPACPRVAPFLFSSSISSFYYCSIFLISGGTEIVNPVGLQDCFYPLFPFTLICESPQKSHLCMSCLLVFSSLLSPDGVPSSPLRLSPSDAGEPAAESGSLPKILSPGPSVWPMPWFPLGIPPP